MACMKVGSKSDIFYLDGDSWRCSTGLPSDIIIEVGETKFHLHKFPLISRSKLLENLIQNLPENEKICVLPLVDLPGEENTFLLIAKFCYGIKFEITVKNIVSLRCAAEHFQMNEDYGESNLIKQTENFLTNHILVNWVDSISAIQSCEHILPHSEDLHLVSRIIDSLATKACEEYINGWPVGPTGPPISKPNWWYDDVCVLKLPLYKRLILSVNSKEMDPTRVSGSLIHYLQTYLPLNGRSSINPTGSLAGANISEDEQRKLLEEIIELLPNEKGSTPTKILLKLLRTSMILHANQTCRDKLERTVGIQLDQAAIEDLLIPNMGYSAETLYDIDCVQQIVDHFMIIDQDQETVDFNSPNYLLDEGQLIGGGSQSLTALTMVANLIDNYLAEVGPDENLKLSKFQTLAASPPDYARLTYDGLYRAIDIYLKGHPNLTDAEKEQLCQLMNCQKLSLEASTHAAQNERLPIRVIVQVLFFEQLRLRTSVAGWFFVSDNIDYSENPRGARMVEDMRKRVAELEKECSEMKQDITRLGNKSKGKWNGFFKKFGLRLKMKPQRDLNSKGMKPSSRGIVN